MNQHLMIMFLLDVSAIKVQIVHRTILDRRRKKPDLFSRPLFTQEANNMPTDALLTAKDTVK